MAEVKSSQPETLLSRDELREVERFQAKFAELERQLHDCVDEFISVLNRHYFNRENGFLREQEENLREIVTIQSKLEALAGNMATGTSELKSRMLELQKSMQLQPRDKASPGGQAEDKPAGDTGADSRQQKPGPASEPKQQAPDKPKPEPAARKPAFKGLVVGADTQLADSAQAGGEISLRLVFEGLRLTDPANSDALAEISSALRKLLYDRKLVGHSKTSLVFGKNRTVGEVLEDLSPIFLSDSVLELMAAYSLIDPGSGENLKLACNEKRELVFIENK